MPRDSCDICCQPGGLALSKETARVQNAQILCAILSATEDVSPSLNPATILPSAYIVYTALNAVTYTPAGFADSNKVVRWLHIYNDTSEDLFVSYNNSTISLVVPEQKDITVNFGAQGNICKLVNDVYLKLVAPAAFGHVAVDGFY